MDLGHIYYIKKNILIQLIQHVLHVVSVILWQYSPCCNVFIKIGSLITSCIQDNDIVCVISLSQWGLRLEARILFPEKSVQIDVLPLRWGGGGGGGCLLFFPYLVAIPLWVKSSALKQATCPNMYWLCFLCCSALSSHFTSRFHHLSSRYGGKSPV